MRASVPRGLDDLKRQHHNAQRKVRAYRREKEELARALQRATNEVDTLRRAIVQLTREAMQEAVPLTQDTGASRYYEGYVTALRHLAQHDITARQQLHAAVHGSHQ